MYVCCTRSLMHALSQMLLPNNAVGTEVVRCHVCTPQCRPRPPRPQLVPYPTALVTGDALCFDDGTGQSSRIGDIRGSPTMSPDDTMNVLQPSSNRHNGG
ncbi:hypothetical protein Vretimale_6124 [Volvox reticuliferus]|uniref:Uncharacterized protein n=1 Tax=Volvox reticuliferus TaxID=1737510 RepID=A0A8J4CBK4_9CHLO|nr:hypothetical protein Vretifemale_7948 [Volvox reticuliferus]GIM01318.1 hypothetical protein Vretimale_6124 [Volvox reticuliferus]